MLGTNPTYRTMLAVDIERSAGRGNVALQECRGVLFTALREAFEQSRIDWETCSRKDEGDGLRIVVGPEVPKTRLIYPLVPNLAVRLRAHNHIAGSLTRIRVRIALHAGDVHVSDGAIAGRPMEELARLLDAPPVKDALAAAPEPVTVALVVSRHIYETTVRHGYPGIDPETYRQVTFTVKETTDTAWLYLPGSVPALAGGPQPGGSAPATARPDHSGGLGGLGGSDSQPIIRAVNVATGNARGVEQVGRIGTRIDHVTGTVNLGTGLGNGSPTGVREQIAELRAALAEHHQAGRLDAGTFADAEAELREADTYASATDEESRGRVVRAMRRLKGLVEEVTDLAAKVAAIISAVRGPR